MWSHRVVVRLFGGTHQFGKQPRRGYPAPRTNPTTHKEILERVGKVLHVEKLPDWYGITHSQVVQFSQANSMLRFYYGHSLTKALETCYPDHEWLPWKFKRVKKNFWLSKENRLRYFTWAMKELGVQTLDGWYNVTQVQMKKMHGNGLIGEYFEGSLIKALQDSYPEHLWQSWKFVKLSQHYWADPQNIREILDYCQEKLKITSMDQWYTVQRDILHELIDGKHWVSNYFSGSVGVALKVGYPDHPWDAHLFQRLGQDWATDDNRTIISNFEKAKMWKEMLDEERREKREKEAALEASRPKMF